MNNWQLSINFFWASSVFSTTLLRNYKIINLLLYSFHSFHSTSPSCFIESFTESATCFLNCLAFSRWYNKDCKYDLELKSLYMNMSKCPVKVIAFLHVYLFILVPLCTDISISSTNVSSLCCAKFHLWYAKANPR